MALSRSFSAWLEMGFGFGAHTFRLGAVFRGLLLDVADLVAFLLQRFQEAFGLRPEWVEHRYGVIDDRLLQSESLGYLHGVALSGQTP